MPRGVRLRRVPPEICRPSYAASGRLPQASMAIPIVEGEKLKKLRASCLLAASVLKNGTGACRIFPGQSTLEIDRLIHGDIVAAGAYPSPLNYNGFPRSVCTSINDVVCHGIPCENDILQSGDLINVDVTTFLGGFHGDTSITVAVGEVDAAGKHLLEVGLESLRIGIEVCRPGVPFALIGDRIEEFVKSNGLAVCAEFIGHGIGENFHSPPDIYPTSGTATLEPGIMREGMVFTIEPAVCELSGAIKVLDDGWTAVTRDGGRSVQFEHTIRVSADGAEILTLL